LSKHKLHLGCHPEYLSNRSVEQTHKVEYTEKSDQLNNNVRKYLDIHSICTNGVDMTGLKRGTPAFELLLKKEREQIERVKAGAAEGKHHFQLFTDEGKYPAQLSPTEGKRPAQLSAAEGKHHF
jgi:hypothetical protein